MRVDQARKRVQLIHGLEGSPQGAKAQCLEQHFAVCTPGMNTQDFEACVQVQADALASFRPQALVGSSFGGAVALALLQQGLWAGPTLLLAQAALRLGLPAVVPAGVPVWIVHGIHDDVIDPADSLALAQHGSPELVRLIEVDDDHRLAASVANGDLVRWVMELVKLSE